MTKYFLIELDNVIKENYCEPDRYLQGVIENIKFPIIAENTAAKGIYQDLITGELIYDIHFFPNTLNLHCTFAMQVDIRFCYFYIKKLNEKSITNYIDIINEIKKYTIKEARIDNQVKKHTKNAKIYIDSFIAINSNRK